MQSLPALMGEYNQYQSTGCKHLVGSLTLMTQFRLAKLQRFPFFRTLSYSGGLTYYGHRKEKMFELRLE